ncbi:hypothetical protein ACIBEJ_33590 [Nonomuraea sp. NPDC050790]|uniref:hypothetical protein n=1 Tax=Nonomuraea sp. NPDC050790 TaxID=3364371 RepID=UPI00379AB55D
MSELGDFLKAKRAALTPRTSGCSPATGCAAWRDSLTAAPALVLGRRRMDILA